MDLSLIETVNKYLPGAIISGLSLLVTIWIFLRQLKISLNQGKILKKVEKTVKNVDGITKRLETNEALDYNIRAFFQISDSNKSDYQCIYPYQKQKDNNVNKPIPDLRLGDSYAVLKLKSLFNIKKHNLELLGVDSEESEKNNECACETDKNCLIICSHLLGLTDKYTPFPTLLVHDNEKPITYQNISESILKEDLQNFPCWFVSCKRKLTSASGEQKSTQKTTVIFIDNKGKGRLLESDIDELYAFGKKDIGSTLQDYAILSRIKKDDKYFILIAGIHNVGTWLGVEYLDQVIYGNQDAPKEFFSDKDFITIVEGDFDPDKKWIGTVKIRSDYFWYRNNNDDKAEWKQSVI